MENEEVLKSVSKIHELLQKRQYRNAKMNCGVLMKCLEDDIEELKNNADIAVVVGM